MALRFLREGAASGFLKFILMGFMVLAVGGLVLTDVGGFFRGGITSTDVIKVGDDTIDYMTFDRELSGFASRFQMSSQEAYQAGLVNQIIAGKIGQSILQQEARKHGIAISRDYMVKELFQMIEPQLRPGQNAQDALEEMLRARGMSEAQFVSRLRKELIQKLFVSAMQSGNAAISDTLAKDLYRIQNEERSFDYIVLPNDQHILKNEPTIQQLEGFYERTRDSYAIPEKRSFTVLSLKMDELPEITISDEELRELYESNINDYKIAEQKTFEQVLINSEEDAQKIYELAQNKPLKDAAAEILGEDVGYISEDSYTEDGIIGNLSQEIFAVTEYPALMEPIKSSLGWHVVNVTGEKPSGTQAFAHVKDVLKKEHLAVAKDNQQFELINSFDEMLLDETPFDEITKSLAASTRSYNEKAANDKVSSDFSEADSALIMAKIFELQEGYTSDILELSDGQVIALRLDSVTPQSFPEFDNVKDSIKKDWETQQKRNENRALALAYLTRIDDGDATLEQIAKEQNKFYQSAKDLTQQSQPPSPISARALPLIFKTAIGKPTLLETDNGVALAVIKSRKLPKASAEDIVKFKAELVAQNGGASVSQYLDAKRDDYSPKINNALLERLYAPQESDY